MSAAEPDVETDDRPEDSEIEAARREAEEAASAEHYEAPPEAEPPAARERPVPAPPPPRAPLPVRRDFQPASPAAVTEAIDEVNRVIDSLREALDTMEEILETLELAESQKTADEREIQSLRSALRQFERRGGEPRPEAPRTDERRRQGRR